MNCRNRTTYKDGSVNIRKTEIPAILNFKLRAFVYKIIIGPHRIIIFKETNSSYQANDLQPIINVKKRLIYIHPSIAASVGICNGDLVALIINPDGFQIEPVDY